MTEDAVVPGGPRAGGQGIPSRAGHGAPGPDGPRQRGGRRLSAVLPGLPQLLAGRWGTGGAALMVWTTCLTVLVLRWRRVTALHAHGLDDWIATAILTLALAGSWVWSWRDVRRAGSPRARAALGPTARAFARNRLAVAGLVVIVLLYLVAFLAPFMAPYDPVIPGDLATERFVGPSGAHPLGTDQFGRDVLSRLLYGARISLSIGFVAVAISVTIGTLLGAVSGFLGGLVDTVVMRVVDMVLAFPRLVLLITVIALFQPSIFLIIVVLGLTQWPATTRIVRGEVLSLREREFVEAARALGYSKRRIILRHLVPNTLAPVIVAATLGIGNTIVLEAGLSFLGLGVRAPTPSWGNMVDAGRSVMTSAWWLSTFPGLAIVFTVLSFNLVGDGLRDALDPRLRE